MDTKTEVDRPDPTTEPRTKSFDDSAPAELPAHAGPTARRRSERGASLVEYALLVALIAVVMVGAVTFLGDATSGSLDRSGSSIVDATS